MAIDEAPAIFDEKINFGAIFVFDDGGVIVFDGEGG